MMVITMLICVVISLNLLHVVGAIDGHDNPSKDYSAEIDGEVLSFTSEFDGEHFIIEDVNLDIEGEGLEVYKSISITSNDEMSTHPGVPPKGFTDDVYTYNSGSFILRLSDVEGEFFFIKNIGLNTISLTLEIGLDMMLDSWIDEDGILLSSKNEHELMLSKTNDVDISVEERLGSPVTISLNIPPEGEVASTYLERGTPEENRRPKYIGRINVDGKGYNYVPNRPGLSIDLQTAKKGSVELTLSNDVSGYEKVHIVLDNDLIGSNVQDISDIAVSLDGSDIEYIGYREFYTSEETEGYYVNITNGETHVFIRMHFSERNLRVYERTPTATSPGINSVYGLLLGIMIVVLGAGALFYKK